MEAEYAKTEFVGIKSVTKEIYRGNTYYVVVTESGEIFGVDARKYPEIRTANEQTRLSMSLTITKSTAYKSLLSWN